MQQQQGDVLIENCKIPATAKKLNHLILAEGEVTGHKHEIKQDHGVAELFEEKGTMYLSVQGGTVTLYHEEHNAQVVEAGEYKIGIVQEYDYETEEARKVVD